MGDKKADLVLKNCNLLSVYTREIIPKTQIAIIGERIAYVGPDASHTLGSKTKVITIDNRSIEINIPPGTQPDTLLSCKGEGLPNVSTKIRGNLQIRIKADIPRYNEEQRNKLRNIKNGL